MLGGTPKGSRIPGRDAGRIDVVVTIEIAERERERGVADAMRERRAEHASPGLALFHGANRREFDSRRCRRESRRDSVSE